MRPWSNVRGQDLKRVQPGLVVQYSFEITEHSLCTLGILNSLIDCNAPIQNMRERRLERSRFRASLEIGPLEHKSAKTWATGLEVTQASIHEILGPSTCANLFRLTENHGDTLPRVLGSGLTTIEACSRSSWALGQKIP